MEGGVWVRGEKIYYRLSDGYGHMNGGARVNRGEEYGGGDWIEFFEDGERIVMRGNGYYKNENIVVSGDYIDHDDGVTRVKGNMKLKKEDWEILGEEMRHEEEEGGFETGVVKGEPRIFLGEDRVIRTERLNYYKEGNEERILLGGGVVMEDSKKKVMGDRGNYRILKDEEGKSYETGYLEGGCEIIEHGGERRVYGDQLEYYSDLEGQGEQFIVKGNGEFVELENSGYSEEIRYLPDIEEGGKEFNKILLLGKNSRLEDGVSEMTGRKIEIYDGEEEIVRVYKDGKYEDRDNGVEIFGDYLEYQEAEDRIEVRGDPLLRREEDDITVYGEKIESFRKEKVSIATGAVKVEQGDRLIYGEKAYFEEENETLNVTGDGVAVDGEVISKVKEVVLDTKARSIELKGVRVGWAGLKGEGEDDEEGEEEAGELGKGGKGGKGKKGKEKEELGKGGKGKKGKGKKGKEKKEKEE